MNAWNPPDPSDYIDNLPGDEPEPTEDTEAIPF